MKYSLRSLMILTAGGVAAGWGFAAMVFTMLMNERFSVPANMAALFMIVLFGTSMISGGAVGAWFATKLGRPSP